MKIYISHSASVAGAARIREKTGRDPIIGGTWEERSVDHPHGDSWFVVQPIADPEPQVESLRQSGRTVIALDVEPNMGLGVVETIDYRWNGARS